MGTASFWGGVRPKRYSGQQEIAPNLDAKNTHNSFFIKIDLDFIAEK
jgi:hypothetical protein